MHEFIDLIAILCSTTITIFLVYMAVVHNSIDCWLLVLISFPSIHVNTCKGKDCNCCKAAERQEIKKDTGYKENDTLGNKTTQS